MRVALIGNIANVHFRLARALRERTDVDAHLYVSTSDAPAWRPEADDPDLAGRYPDWVHLGDWVTARSVLRPASAPLTRALSEYDLVVASGVGPVFAQHTGRPWAFFVTGGDLTVKPFPMTFWSRHPSWRHRAAQVVAGAHQRRAIRSADRILSQPFAPMVSALDRLGISGPARSSAYFPLPVDTNRFTPDGPIAEIGASSDFVVLHPSRLVLDDSPLMRRTGQWKGSDILLRGFAELVARGGLVQHRLALIDQPASPQRADARQLIDDLGLGDHVVWLRPPDGVHFSQPEMAALYRRADAVAVDFGVGWFGYAVLEAAACGRPVVSHIDQATMAQLYPRHPVIDAAGPGAVGRELGALAASRARRRAAGQAARQWITDFHAPDAVAERYASEFSQVVDELLPSA